MVKMRVAIDERPLKSGDSVRGIGVNTREIINALSRYNPKGSGISVECVDFSKANLSKYDLIHYTNFHPYFVTLPVKKPTKVLVTIHDLTPLIYPKNYPPGFKGKLRFIIQKRLIKNMDGILTISQASKKDIVRFMNVDPKKIFVSYLATRPTINSMKSKKDYLRSVQRKYNLPNKFILYVGDVNYNKNIPTLLQAAGICKIPLVICGKQVADLNFAKNSLKTVTGPRDYLRFLFNKPHPELAHFRMIENLFKESRVIRTGYVSDRELSAIYSSASVYVQPSLYEGFGLGVLEAMSCGVPTVVSRTNALTEIAGDAALACDPHNASDMAEKIRTAIEDSGVRAELIRKGEKRCQYFSWEKAALETINIYKKIIETS